jgi:signal transduction histidine kinase
VASLLRAARLEQGEPLTVAEVGLSDVELMVREETARLTDLGSSLAIEVHCEAQPRQLLLDPSGLREAVSILLDNSQRYAASRIDIFIRSVEKAFVIVVRDDGPGLPEGSEQLAFEPFVSLGHSSGAGLGLSIARAIARAHGGDVSYGLDGFAISLPQPQLHTRRRWRALAAS